jgi:hypothetical protein
MMVGKHGKKYPKVLLCVDGEQQGVMVHHLVAAAFLGPRPEGALVLHKNDIKADCRVRNLRYGTHADNMADRKRNGDHRRVLTRKQRDRVRRRRAAGETGAALAREYEISEQYVCDIHKGRR